MEYRGFNVDDGDLKYAAELSIKHNIGSTSILQRYMSIGYNKASYILSELEEIGVVGKENGAKPRKILVNNINDLNL